MEKVEMPQLYQTPSSPPSRSHSPLPDLRRQRFAAAEAHHCYCDTAAERGSDVIKERRRKETHAPSETVSPSRHRSCLAVARVATAASHRQREALPTLLPNRARFTD
ncbi:uncharacterized protein LOC110269553 [Arachis ipaensis]|uniref:uncharacterized protein LOC110269553 n=1 Tax=Arachis ipaensis TaxID=130454 RepID=UPI000A2B6A1E|nr:uncharacterized protein LOC110269553 [Arachis ipaensis]